MYFDQYINDCLNYINDSNVKEAMKYSYLAGGKRLRPKLLFSILKGYNNDESYGYPAAAALEMIHTYSLIHDDLPAMDDDDLRRGKKTCHKMFNEAIAILAGDALLTEAFVHIVNANYTNEQKVNLIKVLSENSGANGMILGQDLDIYYENKSIDLKQIQKIHKYKTGKLFGAALKMGAIIANKYDNLNYLEEIGDLLGLAFQIQDDILDVTSSAEILGKNIGSDIKLDKSTYVKLLGIDEADKMLNQCYDKVEELIKMLNFNDNHFLNLIHQMRNRDR